MDPERHLCDVRRNHQVAGSSGGWLVMDDDTGVILIRWWASEVGAGLQTGDRKRDSQPRLTIATEPQMHSMQMVDGTGHDVLNWLRQRR